MCSYVRAFQFCILTELLPFVECLSVILSVILDKSAMEGMIFAVIDKLCSSSFVYSIFL